MKLEEQVCSLELAQRLKALDVGQYTYFHWWRSSFNGQMYLGSHGDVAMWPSRLLSDETQDWHLDCAAFTVAELGEMLPREQWGCDDKGPKNRPYRIWWSTAPVETDWVAATEADARAKMLIYLIENRLIQLPIQQ